MAANGHTLDTVWRRDGDSAGGGFRGVTHRGQALFKHSGLTGGSGIVIHWHDRWRAVGHAVDGDGQLRGVGGVVRIFQGVGKDFAEGFAIAQCIDGRIGVVQCVRVATICAQGQRAVKARHHRAVGAGGARSDGVQCSRCAPRFWAGADAGNTQIRDDVVRVAVCRAIGAHVARNGRGAVLDHAVGVIGGDWRVVGGNQIDGAVDTDLQRRRPAGIATRLRVVAIAQRHGVAARDVGAKAGGVVTGVAVAHGGQDGVDLAQGRGVGQGDDQGRAARATRCARNACQCAHCQHIARNTIAQGDGDGAGAEGGGAQARRAGQVQVGHGACRQQGHRVDGYGCTGGGVFCHRRAGGRVAHRGRIV